MPEKKKKGGGKKAKVKCPAGMSSGEFLLMQGSDFGKLNEYWVGDVKDTKGVKGKDGNPLPDYPSTTVLTKHKAGLYIWRLIFPQNKASKEKREECIKLSLIETSVKAMNSGINTGRHKEVTPALGIIAALTENLDQARQIFMDSKPSPLPILLKALASDSASLLASSCALLRVLAQKEDSRSRLWKVMKDWDWTPLLRCLSIQDLSQLGGRHAALDAMLAISALCCAPEGPIAEGSCEKITSTNGLEPMVKLLTDRLSHPLTKASILTVLESIMRRSSGSVSEHVINGLSALGPILSCFSSPVVPLVNKAHAAACLFRFIMPDTLWKDQSVLSKTSAMVAKVPASVKAPASNNPLDASQPAVQSLQEESNEGVSLTPGVKGKEPAVPDSMLLDEVTRTEVLRRARIVAGMGAIRPLILLCNVPEGPRPDLEAKAAAEAAAAESGEKVATAEGGEKKKKSKKKGGKKKKGKLEAGQGDAQTFASGVLRLISLDEGWRDALVSAGVVRYMLPLVEAKLSPARWHARQLLINLAMSKHLMEHLTLYNVPAHISGSNLVRARAPPSSPSGLDDLEKLPGHLANSRLEDKSKPPALRSL